MPQKFEIGDKVVHKFNPEIFGEVCNYDKEFCTYAVRVGEVHRTKEGQVMYEYFIAGEGDLIYDTADRC